MPTKGTTLPVREERKHGLLRWPRLFGDDTFGRPMREWLDTMHEDMERMFTRVPATSEMAIWAPRVDVRETATEYVVTADLPGVEPDDVAIEYTADSIRIYAEMKSEREEQGGNGKDGEKSPTYLRRERQYGSFERRFTVPEDVDLAKASSTFKNGVLELRLPRTKTPAPETKRIPVKAR